MIPAFSPFVNTFFLIFSGFFRDPYFVVSSIEIPLSLGGLFPVRILPVRAGISPARDQLAIPPGHNHTVQLLHLGSVRQQAGVGVFPGLGMAGLIGMDRLGIADHLADLLQALELAQGHGLQ